MKKILLTLVIASAFTLVGTAQNPSQIKPAPMGKGGARQHETPEQRAQQSVDKLDKIVTLTADQKTQIYNLALNRAKTVDGIREKYKGQTDKKDQEKQEIQAAHKGYRQSAKKLLTPDQMNKLKEFHKANKENKENGAAKGGAQIHNGGGEDLPTEKD